MLIPYETLDHQAPYWGTTFRLLESGEDLSVIFDHPETSESLKEMTAISQGLFALSLHQTYRLKWDSKHPIPCRSQELRRATEPFAVLLRAALELCIQLHAAASHHSRIYRNASEWFVPVARELREFCFAGAESKTALIKRIRSAVKALKPGEAKNPFGDYSVLAGMVSDAMQVADQSDAFRREFWEGLRNIKSSDSRSRGFISSLSGWATELDKNPVWTRVEAPVLRSEKDFLRSVEGRSQRNLSREIFNRQ